LIGSNLGYINLNDSVYKDWIEQDKPLISNFIDFYLYTLRGSSFGLRTYDSLFWQYWVALPVNITLSAIFIFYANFFTINAANDSKGYEIPSQKSNPVAIFLAVLFSLFVLFNGFKWATEDSKLVLANSINSHKSVPAISSVRSPNTLTNTEESKPISVASIDTSLPNPKVLTMDGSVTMVKMIKLLRKGYTQVNPNMLTTYGFAPNGQPQDGDDVRPTGSGSGLKNLINGRVLIAATSRPLKPDEAKAGIKAIPIARDAIAVVVGKDNPFQGSLTKNQLRDIYTGKITNWSEVGGANLPIKVFNRSPDSGTQGFFKDDVLLDAKFAPEGANFKTWERDEATAVLRVLGNDGIYYTTISQAEKQPTIRVVPIDGINPENREAILNRTYPLVRFVYLAIPKQTSPPASNLSSLPFLPKVKILSNKLNLFD
jgi:phosphate transport system substrate-binding protein